MDVEAHFYRKKFFMGVYSFRNIIAKGSIKKIEDKIFEKYRIHKKTSKVEKPIIIDKDGNYIIINNEVNYSISYLSGDRSLLNSFYNEYQNTSLKKKQEEKSINKHLKMSL